MKDQMMRFLDKANGGWCYFDEDDPGIARVCVELSNDPTIETRIFHTIRQYRRKIHLVNQDVHPENYDSNSSKGKYAPTPDKNYRSGCSCSYCLDSYRYATLGEAPRRSIVTGSGETANKDVQRPSSESEE